MNTLNSRSEHAWTTDSVLSSTSRTRSYKKDDEPLLNLQYDRGYEPLLKREGAYVYTKEGTIEAPL
jgi:hypothetical protein